MNIPKGALVFCGMGILAILRMVVSLWRGEISGRRTAVICRNSDPFQYYAWIFFLCVAGHAFCRHGHVFLPAPALQFGAESRSVRRLMDVF